MSGAAEDPYVYPGTNVLRNRADLRDPDRLAVFEAGRTAGRAFELDRKPLPGRFDADHLKAIHRHLFQDVYDWAGAFRTVDIRKADEYWFARHEFVRPALDELFAKLARESHLKGLDADGFAKRAAWCLGELNAIHPFREGNGRTQREFLRTVGLQAGWRLEWAGTAREAMTEASVISFRSADAGPMAALLARALRLLTPSERA